MGGSFLKLEQEVTEITERGKNVREYESLNRVRVGTQCSSKEVHFLSH